VIRPAPGNVIAGKYQLERALASGGMGSVFVARHLQLDTPVAVKFIDPRMTSAADARTRFEREARTAAQIRNPNVVQVFDHGVDDDLPYIVMELLQGEDLGARLKRLKRLPLPETAAILIQLAKGLRPAHELGIVHRDLKPGNIFITRVADEEVVKILDFGLAKAFTRDASDDMTASGVVMGSPQYMSPEQTRGSKQLDHRSDVWSLGVILYRCVTGTLPYQGDQMVDLVVKICTEPFLPPSKLVPDLPPALDKFFARALARLPEDRYQSVRELASEFCKAIGMLELAPPSGPMADPLAKLKTPTLVSWLSDGCPGLPVPPLPAMPQPPPGPLMTPVPGASLPVPPPWPAAPPAPLQPGPVESPTGTVPGTTITWSMRRASPVRRRLFVAGAAVILLIGVGGLLAMRGGSEPAAPAASASIEGPESPAPTTAPSAAAAPPAAVTASLPTKSAEPAASVDAGAPPQDAGADAAARPQGQVKKRRNFGY
jgi:serine/threonine-protein kinase